MTSDETKEPEENETETEEGEEEPDELMEEIQTELDQVSDPADRAKIMAVLYCGRALEKLIVVLYQRLGMP